MDLSPRNISEKLSLDVFDKCFKMKTNSDDTIQSVVITKAAPVGEGLISAVYRVSVTGSSHKTSFVAKALVSDDLLRRTLRCSKFFAREVLFFAEILPQFKELQKSLGAKEDIQRHIPICYSYYSGNDQDYLILEDLAETSCKSMEKQTKDDRNVILQVLAHFHAVSMALRVKKPDVFAKLAEKVSEEVYYNHDNHKWFAKYLQNALDIDKETLLEYGPESSIYYKKFLEVVSRDPYEQLIELVGSYSGNHPTMNHGDSWPPNFLYSADRAVLIDFQILRCTSPVTDLTYCLALCSELCPSKDDFIEALNVYYSFLEYYLGDMGLEAKKVMSREDFDLELKQYGRFGLLAALTSIPLMSSTEKCDVGRSFRDKFPDVDRIPLEKLWLLQPLDKEHKIKLVNTIRVAVDVGII